MRLAMAAWSIVPRGVVLDGTRRMAQGRSVMHLSGILETGESILVRDRRAEPRFGPPRRLGPS